MHIDWEEITVTPRRNGCTPLNQNRNMPPLGSVAPFTLTYLLLQEEKTLYVTVVAAKDLPAMDNSMFSQSSDPFFLMKCNGLALRTSTKYKTQQPK